MPFERLSETNKQDLGVKYQKQQGKSRAGVQESATKLWHAKYKNDRRSLAEFMSQEVESKQSILKYVKKYVWKLTKSQCVRDQSRSFNRSGKF